MTARMQNDLDTLTTVVDKDPSVGAVILTGDIPGRYPPGASNEVSGCYLIRLMLRCRPFH